MSCMLVPVAYLGGEAGVDVGIFVTSFRASKARKSNAEGLRFLGGSGGMLPREILKSRVSEMPFPALWGNLIEGI